MYSSRLLKVIIACNNEKFKTYLIYFSRLRWLAEYYELILIVNYSKNYVLIYVLGFSASVKPTTIPFDPSVIRDKLSAAGSVIQLLSVEPLGSKSAKVSWEIRKNQRFVEGVHVRRRAIQADDSGSSQRDELGQDFIDITVEGNDVTSFILEGLSPFTRYEVNVQPFYRSVIGTESSSQYITTSEDGKPEQLTCLFMFLD